MVACLDRGKRVGGAWYLAVEAVPAELAPVLATVREIAGDAVIEHNVVKVDAQQPKVSLLHYPGLGSDAFPVLAASCAVDLVSRTAHPRHYDARGNPPVLHRQELLLPASHPMQGALQELTAAAERAGLFDDPSIIGHRLQWEEELRAHGLRVEGLALVPDSPGGEQPIARHRTAIARRTLSTPVQALWRAGLVSAELDFFDYGCGRGDDLALLQAEGVPTAGWDPYFRADGTLAPASAVNLGFVLNVIEDPDERREALLGAWTLARDVLSVGALIGGRTAYERFRLFRDGVLTSIGTFQKYYTHQELGDYIRDTLGREPVGVAPGVYLVFRRDEAEQAFLEARERARPTRPTPMRPAGERRVRGGTGGSRSASSRPASRWDYHAPLVDAFCEVAYGLGRLPEADELHCFEDLRRHVGSPGSVLRYVLRRDGDAAWLEAQQRRRDDLLVWLALAAFEPRRSFSALPNRLQRDVRALLGSYERAVEQGRALLFELGEREKLDADVETAMVAGLGSRPLSGYGLDVAVPWVSALPLRLRIFAGAAARLAGGLEGVDVVRLDPARSRVSLLLVEPDGSGGHAVMIERLDVELRNRRVVQRELGSSAWPAEPVFALRRSGTVDEDEGPGG